MKTTLKFLMFLVAVTAGLSVVYVVNVAFELLSKPSDGSVIAGIVLLMGALLIVLGSWMVMKSWWTRSKGGTAAIAALLLVMGTSCNERIDAGHVGLRVKDYGTEKGVNDIAEVTGRVFYNPFTEQVIEVPTFVQNAVYAANADEDKGNDEFRVTTKDGMIVGFDVSLNYYMPAEKAALIFKKYRRPLKELERGILMNNMRDAFNRAASNYKADEIYEKRASFQQEAEDAVTTILAKDGFVVEQVVLLNELRLPEEVTKNIKAKVSATQIALQKTAELQQSIAEANKKVALARGDSAAQVIAAAGEAEAYNRIRKELSPEMIELRFIEKWDGVLPVYGTVPSLFKNVK